MNLIYAFLNNNFSKIQSNKKDFAYATMPAYYHKTFVHNKQFFDTAYMICQQEEINNGYLFDHWLTVEQLQQEPQYKKIYEILEQKWSRYKIEFFLYHAFMRLIFVCLAIKKLNLKNVVHAEADNIIYMGAEKTFELLLKSGEFGYSLVSRPDAAPGIIFFKDAQAADNFLNQLISLLKKGEHYIISTTGIPFEYITDMNFLYFMYLYNNKFKQLPCLPVGDCADNFDKLKVLFDPAGYGQFLGGTNNGSPPGYINARQFVGLFLQQKLIQVKFDKKPYVEYNDQQIPLYNLHMHNKKAIDNFI